MYSLYPHLRSLILPGSAAPDDPAIIIGPDLPPCMQARYSSAVFFRPPGTASAGIAGAPLQFRAQVKVPVASQQFIDEGFLVYDGRTVCGYVVTYSETFVNLFGSIQGSYNFGSLQAAPGGSGITTGRNDINFDGDKTTVNFGGPLVPMRCDVTIDSTSIGRGTRSWVASQNPTAAIGAETAIMTGAVMTFTNQRAYKFSVDAAYFGSVANVALLRWRQGVGTGGTILALSQHQLQGGGAGSETRFHDEFVIIRTAGTDDVFDQVTVTLQASAGTVTQQGSAQQVRSFKIEDCGAAVNFNAANTI